MEHRQFSIGEGGPFHRLMLRLKLRDADGTSHAAWFIVIGWLPIMMGAAVRQVAGLRVDPLVLDIAVHARLLIAVPLLVTSETLLTRQCRGVVNQLYDGSLVDPEAVDRIVARAERLRDLRWVELAIAIVSVSFGVRLLLSGDGTSGAFSGITDAMWSASRVWYAVVALPLLHFLLVRWLWRWAIWCVLLASLARQQLTVIATHPDRASGLDFLSAPLTAYQGLVMASSSIIAGAWGTQLVRGEATIPALIPTLAIFIVVVLAVGYGPLFVFTPTLFRSRRFTFAQYNPLAREYMGAFHRKWVEGAHSSSALLGTSDIQSLADLTNAYNVIGQSRTYPFSFKRLRNTAIAAVVPMLPLLATIVPLDKMVRRLASALFGIPL